MSFPYTNKPYSAHAQKLRATAAALPVAKALPKLRQTIRDNQVTVLVGETGSGKTTQLPQALLEDYPDSRIVLTQNRQLAAQMSLANNPSFDEDIMGPMNCYPLYVQLPAHQKTEAIDAVAPSGFENKLGRKLLVATNIAETSITLMGITHVIDSCRAKVKIWDPRTESWTLQDMWTSKAVALQRSGRAGRTSRGKGYRMVTQEGFHSQLADHSVPVMQTTDMLSECLEILSMGLNPLTFPYIVAPATETVCIALGILKKFGAFEKDAITSRGKMMSDLPVNPFSAYTIIQSQKFGCVDEILTITAMIEASEGGQVFLTPYDDDEKKAIEGIRSRFRHPSGDHLTLFNIYMAWRQACLDRVQDAFVKDNKFRKATLKAADDTRLQLLSIIAKSRGGFQNSALQDNDPAYYIKILKALAAGNFLRVAKRLPGKGLYQTVRGGIEVSLTRETKLDAQSEWVFYEEIQTTKDGRGILRLASSIAPELLVQSMSRYWSDVEFMPEGHIKDALVKVIASMTGISEVEIGGGMPGPTKPTSA